MRKIILVDMDAFFASLEQRDDPELRGRPVAAGGSRERGVVAAASYEARVFGVRSAMPSVTARRKCPDLVFVKPRFEVYRAIASQLRAIFAEFAPIIEPPSLDEPYLDVTENLDGLASATHVAEALRARIREETGLTASAGVSYNKFLAKLASDHRKPDGLFVINPKMGPAFVASLPIDSKASAPPPRRRCSASASPRAPIWRRRSCCCEASDVRGRTVTLKMKYSDFIIANRSRSASTLIASRDQLEAASIELLRKLVPSWQKVRVLGVSVSSLEARESVRSKTLL